MFTQPHLPIIYLHAPPITLIHQQYISNDPILPPHQQNVQPPLPNQDIPPSTHKKCPSPIIHPKHTSTHLHPPIKNVHSHSPNPQPPKIYLFTENSHPIHPYKIYTDPYLTKIYLHPTPNVSRQPHSRNIYHFNKFMKMP